MTAQAAAVADSEPDLIVRREGAAGIIRLNRPKAINAVTLPMFRDIDRALDAFEADSAVGLGALVWPAAWLVSWANAELAPAASARVMRKRVMG